MQKRIERRIASRGLETVLGEAATLLDRSDGSSAKFGAQAEGVLRAYEHSRLLRSAANRCLTHSLALATSLARIGMRPHLVIGVQALPFTAHCWVQNGDAVLNDSLEEVVRFTPILVL